MAEKIFTRDFQGQAELAHFILEQFLQRFDQLKAQIFRQAADVVMGFYGDGRALKGTAFDQIGIQRSLCQKFKRPAFLSFLFKNLYEHVADDFALFLRVGYAAQFFQEKFFGIDRGEGDFEFGKQLLHFFGFILAQQPVVHKDAMEPVTDGFVHQNGGHGGINSAGYSAKQSCISDLPADGLRFGFDEGGHAPILPGTTDGKKVGQDFFAFLGVLDFRVKLHAVKFFGRVGKGGDFDGGSRAVQNKTGGYFFDRVAVAHPDPRAFFDSF